MLTPIKMNQRFTYGFATLVGLAASALAIEAPENITPVPPRVIAEEDGSALPMEAPREDEVAPPADVSRAYLGIGAARIPGLLAEHLKLAEDEGVVLRTVDPEGPAAKAGLVQNDILTKVSGKLIGSHEALRDAISGFKPGDEIDLDFIHRGEPKTARLALGKAPALLPEIAGEVRPLDRLMLDGMPQDQARRIREAIEQNLRSFDGAGDAEVLDPGLIMRNGMHQRMQQMLQGMKVPEIPDEGGINFSSGSSTLRMLDQDGSVEIKSQDGAKQVRVFGKDGKVQWEGAYDTDEDKKKVPEDVRERIDRLNLDMDFKGDGIRLRMVPGSGTER